MVEFKMGGGPEHGAAFSISITSNGVTRNITGQWTNLSDASDVSSAGLNDRFIVLDVSAQGATGAVTITTAATGDMRAAVLENGDIGIQCDTTAGSQTFSFTDSASAVFDVTVTTTVNTDGSGTIKGWGEGAAYYMSRDSNGRMTPLPSPFGYVWYVSKETGATEWTRQDIATAEGVSLATITDNWIRTNYPLYGADATRALDWADVGSSIWTDSKENRRGSHLYIDARSDWSTDTLSGANGWSPAYPAMVKSYGTITATAMPVVDLDVGNITSEYYNIYDGFEARRGDVKNDLKWPDHPYVYLNMLRMRSELLFGTTVTEGSGPLSITETLIYDVWRDSPEGGESDWSSAHLNRISGIYYASRHALRMDGVIFDHCGWKGDYADNRAYNGGANGLPPSQYSHNMYLAFCADATVRNVISSRAASIGMSDGPGGIVENVITIQNPIVGNSRGSGRTSNNNNANGTYCLMWDYYAIDTLIHTVNTDAGARGWGHDNAAFDTTLLRGGAFNASNAAIEPFYRNSSNGSDYQAPDFIEYKWDGTDRGVTGLVTARLDEITKEAFLDDYLSTTGSTEAEFYTELRSQLRPSVFVKAFSDYIQGKLEAAGKTDYALSQHSVAKTMTFDPVDYSDGRRWSVRWNWADAETDGVPIDGDSLTLKGYTTTMDMDTITLNDIDFGGGILNVYGTLRYTGALSGTDGATIRPQGGGTVYLNGYTSSDVLTIEQTAGLTIIDGDVTGALDVIIRPEDRFTYDSNYASWSGWHHAGVAIVAREGQTTTIKAGRKLSVGHHCIAGLDGISGGTSTLVFEAGATFETALHSRRVKMPGQTAKDAWFTNFGRQYGRIRELRSGIDGVTGLAGTANHTSVVTLNGCTMNVDLSEYVQKEYNASGVDQNNDAAATTLSAWVPIIAVDTLNGTFGTVTATDLRSDQDLEWRKTGNTIEVRVINGSGQIADRT